MSQQQHSDQPRSTEWIITFTIGDDHPYSWTTEANSKEEALSNFWMGRDNPEIELRSCLPISLIHRLSNELVWFNESAHLSDDDIRSVLALIKSADWRMVQPQPVKEVKEEFLLPGAINTNEDFLIRGVYGLAYIWTAMDGDDTFKSISNALHLIAQHSLRKAIETQEFPAAGNDTDIYTYLRDAAMFFDYVANGDNAVYNSSDVFESVQPYFNDLAA